MVKALGAIWRGIVVTYEDLFRLIGLNLIWVIIGSLFYFVLAIITSLALGYETQLALIVSVLLYILLLNPLSTGIYYYANMLAHDERVELSTYWEGVKAYWARGLLLYTVNLILVMLIAFNIVFYLNIPDNDYLRLIALVWMYALLTWLCVQIYLGPLLIEQRNKNILVLYRNAFLLILDNVLFTLTLLLIELVLVFVSVIFLPLGIMIIKSLLANIESQALVTLLEKYADREKKSPAVPGDMQ